MTKDNLMKVIEEINRIAIKNYDKLSEEVTGLSKKKYIDFVQLEARTKKVNDWGRDCDTDTDLVINQKGWATYTTVIEVGAGKSELLEEYENNLSFDEVAQYIEQLDFVKEMKFFYKCYQIYRKEHVIS